MRIGIARALVAVLALGVATAAHAQSGGAYDLSWNTLSGGGQTFAGGGEYRLAGTTGQPDAGPLAGGDYGLAGGFWYAGLTATAGVGPTDPAIPLAFAARLAGANPFRLSTAIHFELPEPRHVSLTVYGVDGRVVMRALDAERAAGRHTVFWDGRDNSGRAVPAGVYFARLVAGHSHATFRLARIR